MKIEALKLETWRWTQRLGQRPLYCKVPVTATGNSSSAPLDVADCLTGSPVAPQYSALGPGPAPGQVAAQDVEQHRLGDVVRVVPRRDLLGGLQRGAAVQRLKKKLGF